MTEKDLLDEIHRLKLELEISNSKLLAVREILDRYQTYVGSSK